MIHFCCPQTTNISVGKSRWVFEWKMYDSGMCVAPICHPEPPQTTLHPPVMVSMRHTDWNPEGSSFMPAIGSPVTPPPANFGSAPPRKPFRGPAGKLPPAARLAAGNGGLLLCRAYKRAHSSNRASMAAQYEPRGCIFELFHSTETTVASAQIKSR